MVATALPGVLLVGPPEGRTEIRVDLRLPLEPLDPAFGLKARDGIDSLGTGQPVEGRERMTVGVPREVPDDQRVA
jgi:hypothetical protein